MIAAIIIFTLSNLAFDFILEIAKSERNYMIRILKYKVAYVLVLVTVLIAKDFLK